MDKVKIKRVKRNKRKTTTAEKIMAGVGVGTTILGGASTMGPKTSQPHVVNTQTQKQTKAGDNIKSKLAKVFKSAYESTVGVPTAKADLEDDGGAGFDDWGGWETGGCSSSLYNGNSGGSGGGGGSVNWSDGGSYGDYGQNINDTSDVGNYLNVGNKSDSNVNNQFLPDPSADKYLVDPSENDIYQSNNNESKAAAKDDGNVNPEVMKDENPDGTYKNANPVGTPNTNTIDNSTFSNDPGNIDPGSGVTDGQDYKGVALGADAESGSGQITKNVVTDKGGSVVTDDKNVDLNQNYDDSGNAVTNLGYESLNFGNGTVPVEVNIINGKVQIIDTRTGEDITSKVANADYIANQIQNKAELPNAALTQGTKLELNGDQTSISVNEKIGTTETQAQAIRNDGYIEAQKSLGVTIEAVSNEAGQVYVVKTSDGSTRVLSAQELSAAADAYQLGETAADKKLSNNIPLDMSGEQIVKNADGTYSSEQDQTKSYSWDGSKWNLESETAKVDIVGSTNLNIVGQAGSIPVTINVIDGKTQIIDTRTGADITSQVQNADYIKDHVMLGEQAPSVVLADNSNLKAVSTTTPSPVSGLNGVYEQDGVFGTMNSNTFAPFVNSPNQTLTTAPVSVEVTSDIAVTTAPIIAQSQTTTLSDGSKGLSAQAVVNNLPEDTAGVSVSDLQKLSGDVNSAALNSNLNSGNGQTQSANVNKIAPGETTITYYEPPIATPTTPVPGTGLDISSLVKLPNQNVQSSQDTKNLLDANVAKAQEALKNISYDNAKSSTTANLNLDVKIPETSIKMNDGLTLTTTDGLHYAGTDGKQYQYQDATHGLQVFDKTSGQYMLYQDPAAVGTNSQTSTLSKVVGSVAGAEAKAGTAVSKMVDRGLNKLGLGVKDANTQSGTLDEQTGKVTLKDGTKLNSFTSEANGLFTDKDGNLYVQGKNGYTQSGLTNVDMGNLMANPTTVKVGNATLQQLSESVYKDPSTGNIYYQDGKGNYQVTGIKLGTDGSITSSNIIKNDDLDITKSVKNLLTTGAKAGLPAAVASPVAGLATGLFMAGKSALANTSKEVISWANMNSNTPGQITIGQNNNGNAITLDKFQVQAAIADAGSNAKDQKTAVNDLINQAKNGGH